MTPTTTHTPGPWNTDCEICPVTGSIAIWHNGPIVYVKDNTAGPENQKANARLIAAAPDLLAACKAALSIWDGNPQMSRQDTITALRAAIARAEGGRI